MVFKQPVGSKSLLGDDFCEKTRFLSVKADQQRKSNVVQYGFWMMRPHPGEICHSSARLHGRRGEGASEGRAFALRERVVAVRGIIGILCKVCLLEAVFPRSLRWVVVKTCKL